MAAPTSSFASGSQYMYPTDSGHSASAGSGPGPPAGQTTTSVGTGTGALRYPYKYPPGRGPFLSSDNEESDSDSRLSVARHEDCHSDRDSRSNSYHSHSTSRSNSYHYHGGSGHLRDAHYVLHEDRDNDGPGTRVDKPELPVHAVKGSGPRAGTRSPGSSSAAQAVGVSYQYVAPRFSRTARLPGPALHLKHVTDT